MSSDGVEIRTIPEIRVAYMRYVGPYGSPRITDMWQRFESWCATQRLPPRRRMFGIAQDNPNISPADQTRYDACVEVDATFQPSGEVAIQTIRAGRYACTPFFGTAPEIQAAWVRFLGRTLPDAGYHPDLCPALEIYETDFAVEPETKRFSCLLCMPLRGA